MPQQKNTGKEEDPIPRDTGDSTGPKSTASAPKETAGRPEPKDTQEDSQ